MNKKILQSLIILIIFALSACNPSEKEEKTTITGERPNILWIYVEDLNPFMSCYGVEYNETPTIDRLAENGILFEKAFTVSPVCSPTRSSLITGMMPTTINAQNHHSSRTVESAIFLPEFLKTIPEIFKEAGYFTFNDGKDDYNFIYDRSKLYTGDYWTHFWYTFEGAGSWNDPARKEGQPFFGQIQREGGKLVLPQPKLIEYYHSRLPEDQRMDPSVPEIPPYYPDVPAIQEDWAMHYDAIKLTDMEVADILDDLEKDGFLENTVIFFFTDHGYKGIRHKQFCYDGGIHIPFIMTYFGDHETIGKGERRTDLVSLLDIGATSLALAGIEIPEYMESKDILAEDYHRDYVISVRDRCDYSIDRIRSVRTDKFKYIKNFMPERSYTQPSYRDTRPEFRVIQDMYNEGELTSVQAKYWKPTKPEEELFDLENDPHEINNLANDPKYKDVLERHRKILFDWIERTDDQGRYPEKIDALRFMYERWGEKCINPEFDIVKENPMPGSAAEKIAKEKERGRL